MSVERMVIDTNILSIVSIGVAVFACIAAVASSIVAVLTYRKSKAPEVIAYLEADRDRGTLLFVVKNIGNGVAYDLTLDVGDLPVKGDLKKNVDESFVRSGVPMLVPAAQRSAIIHRIGDAVREYGDRTYWASLSYYRSRGGGHRPRLPISDKFVLEYYTFAGALYTKSDQYLSRVALERIARGIGR